jgi:hypothetical protein
MFAIVAIVLAILAGLDVTIGSVSPFDLSCFALAAIAAHLVFPLAVRPRT